MSYSDYDIKNDELNLRSILSKYFKHAWIYLLTAALFIGFAVLYLWWKTPLYEIQARLVIKDEKKGEGTSTTIKELDFLDEQKIVDNEAEIVKSENIIRKVVQKLQLNIAYYSETGSLRNTPYHFRQPVIVDLIEAPQASAQLSIRTTGELNYTLEGDAVPHRYGDTVNFGGLSFVVRPSRNFSANQSKVLVKVETLSSTTQKLKSDLTVTAPSKNSSILNLRMLHPSTGKGRLILQEIINEYAASNNDEKKLQADSITRIIDERLAFISRQLSSFEQQAEAYKRTNGITDITNDSRLLLGQVESTDTKISAAQIQLNVLTGLETYVTTASGGLAPPQTESTDPVLIGMINRLSTLEMEKETMMKTVGEGNPLLEGKRSQIANLRKAIIENIGLQKSNLKGTIRQLSSEKSAILSDISLVPANERNLLEIIREKSIRENIYTFLLQKREEASITNASVFSKMRVIDAPYSSATPVKPNKLVVVLSALLLSLIVPTFIINIRRGWNNTVSDRNRLISSFDGVPLAEIGHISKFNYNVFSSPSPNVALEQFRRLRATIVKTYPGNECRSILVTSSTASEGKSFTSLNLAMSFASNGYKTLMMDLDLRNPRLHSIIDTTGHGTINDLIRGNETDLSKIIVQHPDFSDLYLLPASKAGNDAFELQGKMLDELFRYLKSEYDFIVMNTPPYRLFSDALQLEKFADVNVFVLRYGFTRRSNVVYLQEALRRKEFKNPMIVLNDIPLQELYEKQLYKGEYFTTKS
jgi:tyrosine-protein kinase Etk/Wzc